MSMFRYLHEALSRQPIDLPVFNPVALDLLQLLAEPEINYFEVIRAVKEDEALSAQVLKMSNSPSYMGRVKCETIEHSAIRLGTQQIANLAIAASHASLHTSDNAVVNDIMQNLWLHSHACALGCRSIALKTGHQSFADHAYMAGLLHDIGKLYLLKAMERINTTDSSMQLDQEVLHDVFSEMHVEFGCRIMDCWNIPGIYRNIVAAHHAEYSDSDDFLLAIVRMVNISSRTFNFSRYPTKKFREELTLDFSSLQIQESHLSILEGVMRGATEDILQ
ncbi:MAG: HDOD domain-containing protein [Pelobacteraceae bacterium]